MVRKVLAVLMLGANQVIHVDRLIEELWDNSPPMSAVTTVQTYIYQLRRAFEAAGITGPAGEVFVTKRPGYIFVVDPEQIDVQMFHRLAAEGSALLEARKPERAAVVLRQALGLWTGPPLENVALGRLLEAHAVLLAEERLRALELRIQADVMLNRHRELIGELRSLTTVYPLNEWFHGQLMSALSRCGRRGEALDVYRRLHATLNNELGLDPSPELQRMQRNVLRAA
ncbi:AfsR/SARP family transcriptional regulator [Asanoa iriomotensis]|nr:AfsR/SARP family transcriptional regulator [Asanoa iriomotensis]